MRFGQEINAFVRHAIKATQVAAIRHGESQVIYWALMIVYEHLTLGISPDGYWEQELRISMKSE